MRHALTLLTAVVAAASLPDLIPLRARGGLLYTSLVEREAAHDAAAGVLRNSTPNYFDQVIFHENPSKGTFKQRWFVDYSHWDQKGPIFVELGGEGPAGSSPGGMAAVLGAQLNALLITLEHRYYGDSFPTPLSDKATFMATLSVETALADAAAFVTAIKAQLGTTNKWLVVGGSYSGGVSAPRHTPPRARAASRVACTHACHTHTHAALRVVP